MGNRARRLNRMCLTLVIVAVVTASCGKSVSSVGKAFSVADDALTKVRGAEESWGTLGRFGDDVDGLRGLDEGALSSDEAARLRALRAEIDEVMNDVAERSAVIDAVVADATVPSKAETVVGGSVTEGNLKEVFLDDLHKVTEEAIKGVACDQLRALALVVTTGEAPAGDEEGWTGNIIDAAVERLAERWTRDIVYRVVAFAVWADGVTQAGTEVADSFGAEEESVRFLAQPSVRTAAYQYAKFCHGPPPLG